jgi:UDP-glucose 4-epimerase
MKRILITGANSYVGTNIERWLLREPETFHVDTVDTMNDIWRFADFSKYDVVFHVAGIAHVDPKPSMAPLYYKVNCDLTAEIAQTAKAAGVKQFIFMSSEIVYHCSKSLKPHIITAKTQPDPNDFYGDSKLKAEEKLHALESPDFKVVILRPPMIYGPNCKGNFLRLGWLATKVPCFPNWHNKRSMLYIDNLAELVKHIVLREKAGTFYPQNKEFSDTVEIVRYFANKYNHKMWISKLFNPFVIVGSWFLPQVPKMFADSYYEPSMSKYDFDYQLVSLKDSMKDLQITEANRKMK